MRRLAFALVCWAGALQVSGALAQQGAATPWAAAQVTPPANLAAQLQGKSTSKPVILQVGFAVLYRSEHIPGSIYAGPASTSQGLQTLEHAVAKLPKSREIYLYCGCCPMNKCPNIRPAFAALQKMGFTHLHVLMLDTSFGKDWVAHGYPVTSRVDSPK
ncbi:MAG TPA: rhodanese-like domain-containing protein [Acidobacteriaceae bacterium]|nr:rhodanese-like domain-containing protein [Acidobacteriaceae bacterium]